MTQTIHADHQSTLRKHSLMERRVSWANSTPLWGLINTFVDNWLIIRSNPRPLPTVPVDHKHRTDANIKIISCKCIAELSVKCLYHFLQMFSVDVVRLMLRLFNEDTRVCRVCPNYCSRSNAEAKLTQKFNKQVMLTYF